MILRATVVLGLLISLAAAPSEAQQRCTTTYNQVFKQYETHCSDGSRTTESYNPVFKQ